MASQVNIKVVNELGEVVYPQGVDWEKWKKRLKNALDWLSLVLNVIVVINSAGGGGGFRIQRIIIEPVAGLQKSR
jgi:hypothetical protein